MAELAILEGGRSTSERVSVARYLLAEYAMEAQVAVHDIDEKLAEAYALVWTGRRAKALLVISGLQVDMADARRAFRAIAGLAEDAEPDPPAVIDRPAGPRRAPARRRRDRVIAATARAA
jgi:hypothetical protein